MAIKATLSLEDGKVFATPTSFEVRPEIGDLVTFWRDGRELTYAKVHSFSHHQTEEGYDFVVHARVIEERPLK